MNNGVIAARYKLKELAKGSYITVGRLDNCDITASIPGASRVHCYLQYGDGFDGRGWYVYDKSSTQGTFVNKQEVPKGVYYKARAGSIIQITSKQLFIRFALFQSIFREQLSLVFGRDRSEDSENNAGRRYTTPQSRAKLPRRA